MSLKIIGGKAKGCTLVNSCNHIRPTSVLLRRKFFDSFQDLEGVDFVDLCAGSASFALEAWSRNASKVYINEKDFKAYKQISKNILKCQSYGFTDNVILSRLDFRSFLKNFTPIDKCILFFDPPYEQMELYEDFFEDTKQSAAILMVEFCRQKTLSEKDFQMKFGIPDKKYQQGTSFLYIYNL